MEPVKTMSEQYCIQKSSSTPKEETDYLFEDWSLKSKTELQRLDPSHCLEFPSSGATVRLSSRFDRFSVIMKGLTTNLSNEINKFKSIIKDESCFSERSPVKINQRSINEFNLTVPCLPCHLIGMFFVLLFRREIDHVERELLTIEPLHL